MTLETPSPAPARPPGRWDRRLIGPFTLTHIVALLGTLLGTGLLLTLLTAPIGTATPTLAPRPVASFFIIGERTEGLSVGQVAPELSGMQDGQPVTLTDLDGNVVTLAALRGRPVWVNFWASWCPPCQLETPVLREAYAAHLDDGLALGAVSVQEASPEEVQRYAETYDLPYTIGFDGTSQVFHAWRGYGLPTSYFIDAEGIIRAVHYGPLSMAAAEDLLSTIIPAASPDGPGLSPSPGG
ncbi:MAG: TlpA family protein disulfide reductase [Chloroflexi bacterium]|nr:TlpA family protein disulfide reductase [Chloroflexota bacterium]